MRTALLNHDVSEYSNGDTERKEFACPCGHDRIVEEHDNIPGFRDHDVWIQCPECAKKYILDVSKGISSWQILPKEN